MFPLLLPELEPKTFQSWVHCSTTELPQLPKAWLRGANAVSVPPCMGGAELQNMLWGLWACLAWAKKTWVQLTTMTFPQTMSPTCLVMWDTKSTSAGRFSGSPVSTSTWGLQNAIACHNTLVVPLAQWAVCWPYKRHGDEDAFILWHFVITLDVHQSGVSGILMYNWQWERDRQRYRDKTAT